MCLLPLSEKSLLVGEFGGTTSGGKSLYLSRFFPSSFRRQLTRAYLRLRRHLRLSVSLLSAFSLLLIP